jgi:hypothetical protein
LCESRHIIANIAFNPHTTGGWDREEYFDQELYTRTLQETHPD